MVKVTFLHPDLGIGGAERLVVDAAIAAKNSGHSVHIVTTHHSANHCFPETNDGTLPVTVAGDWLPRSIFGKCRALCMYTRMVYAALYLTFFSNIVTDIVFCDLVSVCVPVLHLKIKHVIFYCHYPDMLLSHRGSMLKNIYRLPLNWLEEITTKSADVILVNSRFTKRIFTETFKRIKTAPAVLYPSVNTGPFDNCEIIPALDDDKVFLCLNRFERKKCMEIAIEALAKVMTFYYHTDIKLVIAGGYDEAVEENVEYYQELNDFTHVSGVSHAVSFVKSPSDERKISLLKNCKAVLYTPSNEHFGIVPLEAMYCKKPVIAVNSGGPMETVIQKKTGFLCPADSSAFSGVMDALLTDDDMCFRLGEGGRRRFDKKFSFSAFTRKLNEIIVNELAR